MCGIVGYIGDNDAADTLLDGLRRLEYRGYDSAGVAVLNGSEMALRRSVGKLSVLEDLLKKDPVHGTLGLGHTRWATHGRPSLENAHPHSCCRNKIFVVHNGIIDHHTRLRRELEEKGHRFRSQTDTEVLAHAIEDVYAGDILAAVKTALLAIEGSYALGVVCADEPGRFIAVRRDSPLVLGVGDGEMFAASDVPALLSRTRKVIFLEDGDVADVRRDRATITDAAGTPVVRPFRTIDWDARLTQKCGHKHFMLKEIMEQGDAVRNTFHDRVNLGTGRVELEDSLPPDVARSLTRVCLVGCGTSLHAGLVARHWMEEIARLPCDVEIASEYRYRRADVRPGTLVVAVTQSGETADTLAALRNSKKQGLATLAVCNVVGSSAVRDSDHALYTRCGPEIGVASTKAFLGQLTALFLLALYLGRRRGVLPDAEAKPLLEELALIPRKIQSVLNTSAEVEKVARAIGSARDVLFLGRHVSYPVALEGALKMKELTYLHAEGYPAGEMKHGPIAMIEAGLPVVAVVPRSAVREKMISNIEEVKARGGLVIAVAEEEDGEIGKTADFVLSVPGTAEALSPLLTIVPLQLLAYHAANLRGCDVDQPRNLAKSVTVE